MRDTYFSGNTATNRESATISMDIGADMHIKYNATFINNEADAGGAIRMSDFSKLIANDTVFSSNRGRSRGGCITAFDESSFTIWNCTFTENTAEIGAVIFMEDILDSEI